MMSNFSLCNSVACLICAMFFSFISFCQICSSIFHSFAVSRTIGLTDEGEEDSSKGPQFGSSLTDETFNGNFLLH